MANEGFEYQESMKDALEAFFANPTKDSLPAILDADTEYDFLDYKREWHEKSKLSKHMLAFANSGGGAIVIGVDETDEGELISVGVQDQWNRSTFGEKIEKYIPEAAYDCYAFETLPYGDVYDEKIAGKTFQVVLIEGAGEAVPLVATGSGANINEGFIYVRRHASSLVANYEEVQNLISQRFEGGVQQETAELHEELRQLKTLYNEIDKIKTQTKLTAGLFQTIGSAMFETKRNPKFPDLDYEEFVAQTIEKKQIRIERRLNVDSIHL